MHKLKPILTGRIVLAFTALVLSLIIFVSLNQNKHRGQNLSNREVTLEIKNIQIKAEVADNQADLARGLSERPSLDENTGMYFNLGGKKVATFWMKSMLFPIDIIWIEEQKIVGINENVPIPVNGMIPTYTSPQAVTHVLEVNAGFVRKNNVKIGDKVEIIDD